MKNSEWNEIYFGVKEPHILQFPHVVFEPNKKNFNIVFQSIKDVPDIWGKPVPYDEKGNPTVEGADRWGFPVKSEDDVNKITDYSWGLFIPLYCDDSGLPVLPDGKSALPMSDWAHEINQKLLLVIWNLGNDEADKMILDCNCFHSNFDPLIGTFFEVKQDITSNMDQLIEKLGWFISPVGPDDEYSVLVASNKNQKIISQIIEKMEGNHL